MHPGAARRHPSSKSRGPRGEFMTKRPFHFQRAGMLLVALGLAAPAWAQEAGPMPGAPLSEAAAKDPSPRPPSEAQASPSTEPGTARSGQSTSQKIEVPS